MCEAQLNVRAAEQTQYNAIQTLEIFPNLNFEGSFSQNNANELKINGHNQCWQICTLQICLVPAIKSLWLITVCHVMYPVEINGVEHKRWALLLDSQFLFVCLRLSPLCITELPTTIKYRSAWWNSKDYITVNRTALHICCFKMTWWKPLLDFNMVAKITI